MTPRRLIVEELESRLAPATLVSPKLVTYRDTDGDRVAVRLSKPLLTAANVDTVFQFNQGQVNGNNSTGQQLQAIDLTGLAAGGVTLTIQATRTPQGGNGRAAVGFINADGLDLFDVTVDGDLGRIVVGDNDASTRGIRRLHVASLGASGLSTQASGGTLESVITGKMASLTIDGSIVGARIRTEGGTHPNMGTVHIGGSIKGGSTTESGELACLGHLTNLYIGGSIIGGTGINSGQVVAGSIGTGLIKGNIVGGSANFSGQVFCNAIGNLQLDGSIQGGSAYASGQLFADQHITNLLVKGSIIGGTAPRTGGIYVNQGELTQCVIKGKIQGGDLSGATSINNTGYVQALQIGDLTVKGSVIAGNDTGGGNLVFSGAILAGFDIHKLRVGGSLVGNTTHAVTIAAAGAFDPTPTTDYAIGAISIQGRVENAQILAGWLANSPALTTPDPVAVNPDAQIGSIVVGKRWIASNLVAGITPGTDALFGTADDQVISSSGDQAAIHSRIDQLWIKGQVLGTAATDDHFGIVAQGIVHFKLGNVVQGLQPAPVKDVRELAATGDVTLREV